MEALGRVLVVPGLVVPEAEAPGLEAPGRAPVVPGRVLVVPGLVLVVQVVLVVRVRRVACQHEGVLTRREPTVSQAWHSTSDPG